MADSGTEDKILAAAETIFHAKGFDGTRMQEVADHAGINKGLLHYYFKTKDKLFEAIFSVAINGMVSKIAAILELERPLEEKMGMMIDQYIALLLRNPLLPRFVLHELHKSPDAFITKHIGRQGKEAFRHFEASVQEEIKAGRIKAIDPRQLFMNLMSLLIFPFIGRPMMEVVTGTSADAYRELLIARKEHIKSFIHDALRA